MSDTEQLFILAGFWTAGALVLAYFIPSWWAKIATVALLVGIPFWELPYGYYNFEKLCDESKRLQLTERIQPQERVCIEEFDAGLVKELLSAGFNTIELLEPSENARDLLTSGKMIKTIRSNASSSYCIAVRNNIHMPWRMLRSDTEVRRLVGYQVIARQSAYEWKGLWWQEEARPVLGRGGLCATDWRNVIAAIRHGSG